MKCLAQGHMGSSLRPDSQAGTPVSPALHNQVAGEPFLLCAEALGEQGAVRSLRPGAHLALVELH